MAKKNPGTNFDKGKRRTTGPNFGRATGAIMFRTPKRQPRSGASTAVLG